jgi:hypothetical protein
MNILKNILVYFSIFSIFHMNFVSAKSSKVKEYEQN